MPGRANAALNILRLGGAFALQYLTGVILSWWLPVSGHPPTEAYKAAFGLSVVLTSRAVVVPWLRTIGDDPSIFGVAPAGKADITVGRSITPVRDRRACDRQPHFCSTCAGRSLAPDRHCLGHAVRKPGHTHRAQDAVRSRRACD